MIVVGGFCHFGEDRVTQNLTKQLAQSSKAHAQAMMEAVGHVSLDDVVTLDDMEAAAKRVLIKQDYDYYAG